MAAEMEQAADEIKRLQACINNLIRSSPIEIASSLSFACRSGTPQGLARQGAVWTSDT